MDAVVPNGAAPRHHDQVTFATAERRAARLPAPRELTNRSQGKSAPATSVSGSVPQAEPDAEAKRARTLFGRTRKLKRVQPRARVSADHLKKYPACRGFAAHRSPSRSGGRDLEFCPRCLREQVCLRCRRVKVSDTFQTPRSERGSKSRAVSSPLDGYQWLVHLARGVHDLGCTETPAFRAKEGHRPRREDARPAAKAGV